MKKVLLGMIFFASWTAQALEYESQFENDQIRVARIKVEPHEEIGLHRDAYPQIVIALKGGTITRLEADGRTVEVNFPTGVAVVRDADPEEELHKSVNPSSEAVELIAIQLKNTPPSVTNKPENSRDISVNIKINCPTSDEFQEFMKSLPTAGNYSSSFDEWKGSFVNTLNQLVHLVESEKIFNSWWSVHTGTVSSAPEAEDSVE